ncbi:alpha-2,3-sialyltransferase [Campylobacter lari]|nr:alpha-2,3-sialyltransferase [Campylobacter lari]
MLWFTKVSNFCVPNAEDKDKIKIYLKYRIGIECDIKRPIGYECSREKDHIINFEITQLNQVQSKLSFQTKYGTAKSRIQNQLSYKLGQAMIVNSKSILGYIRMPFVLSYIKDKHKQEQKIYQEKIKKNPLLALPPLKSYLDYKEALKEKECFTYKLGQALIQANKTWYKGGYIKLLFEVRKLKREIYVKKDIR